jgi:hypothetical protein
MTAMGGAYRRSIELVTASPSVVRGELEDDFHHFRVSIAHDGSVVTAVDGEAVRHPWSTCPDALGPLRDLVGAPITRETSALAAHADARKSCTHWYDLAGLAIAQAAAGRERRRYEVTIPDRAADGRTTAHLSRDDEPVLDWTVDAQTVLGPEPYADQPMGRGFLAWAASTFAADPDAEEAAVVLRRACRISLGRLMDLDEFATAADVNAGMDDTCHTFSTTVQGVALRMKGSSRR